MSNDTSSKSPSSKPEALKCSECLFFKHYPHGKQCCSDQGIRSFSPADEKCFVPDVSQISTNIDQFMSLVSTLHSFTPKQLRIALAIISSSSSSDHKYSFGSKVYIKTSSGDYLSNYRSAYVLGYMPDGNVILSGSSSLNSKGKNFLAFVNDSSCLSFIEWEEKKRQLISKGHITDPDNLTSATSAVEEFSPESVPTIDTAPDHWYTKEEPTEKKKRKDSYDRLIEFA